MTSLGSRSANRNQRDYSPVSWTHYFDEAHDVFTKRDRGTDNDPSDEKGDSFRVYMKNFHHPYAPNRELGQSLDPTNVEMTESELSNYSNVPTLVTLHGGGYSSLTWAQFARHIEQHCLCRILAIDLRAHGDTKTSNDEQMDIDTLVSDVIDVTHAAHKICGFPETPKLVLIGHSMGGAIAVNCATRCTQSLPSLIGFVIIDVVEGTAKDALPLMMSVIKTRPKKFPSLCNAIEWSVRSGMAKNSEAARVSMPGNLVNISSGYLSIHDVPREKSGQSVDELVGYSSKLKRHKFHISLDQLVGPSLPAALLPPRLPLPPRVVSLKGSATYSSSPPTTQMPISEEISTTDLTKPSHRDMRGELREESESAQDVEKSIKDDDGYKRPPEIDATGYSWRTNLAKTQPYWSGWFDGLSDQLLNAPVQGKFLLLAGIDRLDKTLTIGHMQGKFMMKVLPKCGHAVHEDVPEQVALAIGDFLVRNKFAAAANR